MSRYNERHFSDFSDEDTCDQMDKENQQDANNENTAPAPSVAFGDDHQRRIFEQQQYQRQQYYSQQQRDRRAHVNRRHSQPDGAYSNHSSPDNGNRSHSSPENGRPYANMQVGAHAPYTAHVPHAPQAPSASSSDSDSSSSDSDAGEDVPESPFNGTNQSDSVSPVEQLASSVYSANAENAMDTYAEQAHNVNVLVNSYAQNEPMDVSMGASQDPPAKSPEPVPEYMIDRIDQEKWPGVNGDYDNDGEWREWHEMTTAVNVYTGDIVNILPYVNISC